MAEDSKVGDRKSKIKQKVVNWLKDPHNKIFLAILILGIIIRVYFFYHTLHQTVWWDSADYLTEAKVLSGQLNVDYFFTARRTFLLPLIWSFMFRLGFGEVSLRFIELLFSILAIPAIYLLSKEMFNKKVGLIASFLMAVFWMHLFYSNRLMTEIPALTFFIFSLYFFWKGYYKEKTKLLIWFGIFLGLAFLTRAGTLVMFAVFPIYLLFTERLKFLKRKDLWLGVSCTLVLMASFFIFTSIKQKLNALSYFLALTPGTSQGEPRFSNLLGLGGIGQYFQLMPHYFGMIFLVLFLLGLLVLLFYVFVSFDLIIKNNEDNRKYFFILILALVPFVYQATLYHYVEDRYLMNAFPAFFIILALGLSKIGDWLNKYYKHLGAFVITLLLLVGAYQQITYGQIIIDSRITSYTPVKDSALWIKENSLPTDSVISASVPQMSYYSEREVFNIPQTQQELEKIINGHKPKFLMLSIFELGAHPAWLFSSDSQNGIMSMPYLNSSVQFNPSTGQIISIDLKQEVKVSNVTYKLVYPQNNLDGTFVYELTY